MLVSHWPISSAKPPRGSLQVPVTNCMSRSRTSLSTSFTSCREGNDARTFITDFLRLVKDLHPRRLYGEFTAIWDTLRKKTNAISWSSIILSNPALRACFTATWRERKHKLSKQNKLWGCAFLYLPEPDDLFAVPGVVTIHSVSLPVLQVYFLHATQHHLV